MRGLLVGLALLLATPAAGHEGFEARVAELTLAIDLAPDDVALRLERADLLRRLGRYDQSLADLDRAAGQGADVWLPRGLTLFDAQRHRQAEAALSRAIEARDGAAARSARSAARAAQGNQSGAIDDCARAAALEPTPTRVLECGALQERAGRPADAADTYRTGLKALGAAVIRYRWVSLEVSRGRFDEALALLEEASPGDERALRRAEILSAAGRKAEARAAFEAVLAQVDQALARRPNDLRRVSRARALLGLGRQAEAVAVLEAVVARSPRLHAARELLGETRR